MSRYDSALNPVLEKARNEELRPIVKVLLDKFSNSIDVSSSYKNNPNNPRAYTDLIASEIREMGGNSFANLFRGEGVSYREVVCDVADKFNVGYSSSLSVAGIEQKIVEKIFADAWKNLSDSEKAAIVAELGSKNRVGGASAMSAQALFKLGGFTSYKLTLIVVNAVSKALFGSGLSLVANAGITRALGILTGPIGWVVTGLWTLIDVAGPSFKTTAPCVLYVAAIRQRLIAECRI